MIRTWLLTSLLFLQAMAALAQGLPPSEVKTEQLRATLVAHAPQGLRGGQGIWLGLRLQHEPHWHTYWRNPGDSGLPTTLEWTLPPGFVAGEIDWPAPRRLPVGPLMNHGYEGIVVLPVQVQVPPNFQGDQLDIRVQAQWLVCKDVCIPDGAQLGLSLPARAASSLHAADFEAAWAARPVAAPAALQGSAQVNPDQPTMDIRVKGWPAAMQGRGLELYVEQAEVLNPASSVPGTWADGVWTARWPLAASRSTTPDRIDVVLRIEGQPQTWRMNWPVQGNWPDPALSAPATPSENPSPTASSSPPDRSTFLMSLLLAALGGALLNLMPCVFPVLSLKVLALSRHPAERRALLAGGLAYSIGVVASFLALAGLLLALRAGGEQLGWGFQLQSPAFVIALILLFTLMGLNLAGVWSSGTWLPASWGGLRLKHPLAESALTGLLAVAVASPCTAPFLGAALGWAVALPVPQALSVFGALGVGMAAPYLLACAAPGWTRWMPRPGAWMDTFKQLMAFPMWATALWLLWVLGQQLSLEAVIGTLACALTLGLLAWATQPGRGWRIRGLATIVAVSTVVWAWPSWQSAPSTPSESEGATASASAQAPGRWGVWSPNAVQAALQQGRPVFVDFTAAWCVTCQFNKRTVLNDEAVTTAFAAKGVQLLRADWTRRDPAITQALAALGRNGVPVYVLMRRPGEAGELFSEILSKAELLRALEALPAPPR